LSSEELRRLDLGAKSDHFVPENFLKIANSSWAFTAD